LTQKGVRLNNVEKGKNKRWGGKERVGTPKKIWSLKKNVNLSFQQQRCLLYVFAFVHYEENYTGCLSVPKATFYNKWWKDQDWDNEYSRIKTISKCIRGGLRWKCLFKKGDRERQKIDMMMQPIVIFTDTLERKERIKRVTSTLCL
jgi:hypothetical protein